MISGITRQKLAIAKIGNKNATGHTVSCEAKEAMRVKNLGRFVGPMSGRFIEWNQLSYGGRHIRVRNKWGKANKCEDPACDGKSKTFHWSNQSGQYLEDKNDWKMLCNKCHFKYDNVGARANQNRHISIVQKNAKGEIVKIYKGIQVAADTLQILQSSISNVLTGRSKTAGGFIWEYLS